MARITISRNLRLSVEIVKPIDHEAPICTPELESVSPTTTASRILENLCQHINPEIRLQTITIAEQKDENPPEYMDFYELDGDGISVMRTIEPVFIADYDGGGWITPGPFRVRTDIPTKGWAYFFTEAYETLEELNALQPK